MCPMSLPANIKFRSHEREFEELESIIPTDCMEIGSCSYICPHQGTYAIIASQGGAEEKSNREMGGNKKNGSVLKEVRVTRKIYEGCYHCIVPAMLASVYHY